MKKKKGESDKARHSTESLRSAVLVALIGVAGVALGALLGAFLTHWLATEKENAALVRESELERLSFYQQLKIHLDASRAAFENQLALRDRLEESLKRRYGPSPLEYEPLFEKYYSEMNDEERFLCKQMRGITETLHLHNSEIRDLLTKYPKFYGEISKFKDLYEHLDLWISKYNRPFKDKENQCLVYVGVAEGKGFPPSLDEKVGKRLSELQRNLSDKE